MKDILKCLKHEEFGAGLAILQKHGNTLEEIGEGYVRVLLTARTSPDEATELRALGWAGTASRMDWLFNGGGKQI